MQFVDTLKVTRSKKSKFPNLLDLTYIWYLPPAGGGGIHTLNFDLLYAKSVTFDEEY